MWRCKSAPTSMCVHLAGVSVFNIIMVIYVALLLSSIQDAKSKKAEGCGNSQTHRSQPRSSFKADWVEHFDQQLLQYCAQYEWLNNGNPTRGLPLLLTIHIVYILHWWELCISVIFIMLIILHDSGGQAYLCRIWCSGMTYQIAEHTQNLYSTHSQNTAMPMNAITLW